MIPLEFYLILSGVIFGMGLISVLINRNLILVLISLEVMLAGVNLALVALSHYMNDIRGQVLALFSIAVAAGSVAVGLSLLVAIFDLKRTIDTEELKELKEEVSSD
ncbi:MAG: NADH-quinone oxidoreductase subunit NuoK [Thermodesulfovibrionales bacterium]|nr:NADH-quinone oxidoreductase subunit NuoK [Thermodesulfovibrionales bacterium]